MALTANERGVEIMAVSIDGKACGTYEGLAGTFAGFTDSCIRHKALPGYYRTGLTMEAELKGQSIRLVLSGKRTSAELMEIMDIALLNIVAFPCTEGEAECFIEVKSEQ